MIFIEYPYKNVFDQLNPPILKKTPTNSNSASASVKKAVLSHL